MSRYALFGPLGALAIWSLLTYCGLIDRIFLPAPDAVGRVLLDLTVGGVALFDIWSTVWRWLSGLAIGAALGVPLGLAMGYTDKVYRSLELLVDFFRSIPIMTLFPLALVLFGIGNQSKVLLAAWAAMLYVLLNAMHGVQQAKQSRLKVAMALRATRTQTFLKVIFPDALPAIIVGLRMSVSMTLVIVVASEMVMGTQAGLGRRIFDSALVYKMEEMYACVLIAGLLGYASNKLLVAFERQFIHWRGK